MLHSDSRLSAAEVQHEHTLAETIYAALPPALGYFHRAFTFAFAGELFDR
jgi:hypothetical protein